MENNVNKGNLNELMVVFMYENFLILFYREKEFIFWLLKGNYLKLKIKKWMVKGFLLRLIIKTKRV